MSRKFYIGFILIFGLLGGCGSEPEPPSGGQIGNLAPDFALERLDGGQLTLSSLRGKAVLVDFWDTWCPPCRRAMPHLQELSEQYKDDLVVVGVAFGRNGPEAVRSYVKKNNLTFEFALADPQMNIVRDFGGINNIPTTYLINPEGVITHKWEGAKSKSTYEQGIRQIIGL